MMAIILSVLTTILALMVAFFLAVANVNYLVESDFMNKAMNNAVVHGLQYGQLGYRAKVLGDKDKPIVLNSGYLRKTSSDTGSANARNNLTYTITVNQTTDLIDVDVQVK